MKQKNSARRYSAARAGHTGFGTFFVGRCCVLVKGTSRRVIVVDSPDTELFEQAIFIVRNDAAGRSGVTAQRLVDEACRVARSCGRTQTKTRNLLRRGSPALWCGMGAGGIALAWLLSTLI